MDKPLVSIVIPIIPGRTDRINAMLSRLTISLSRSPEIKTEVIVVDGGSTDHLQQMCEKYAEYIDLKYIYLPIGGFINAAYPRNVGFRVATGEVICMLDADYWPSENLIEGIWEPYKNGDRNVINNGYVIDSSKGKADKEGFAGAMLDMQNFDKEILGMFEYAGIPAPSEGDNHIWLWAAPRKNIIEMGGYDEKFVCGYSREDDSFFYRLMKSGLKRYKKSRDNFCCIHIWHPASQRNDAMNALNREYYQKMGGANPTPVTRNDGDQWGKLIKNSFSTIGGKTRDVEGHEEWVARNTDNPAYFFSEPWETVDELKSARGYSK